MVCEEGVAIAFGTGLTVPLTATFWVVAPEEVHAIFPDGVPVAAALKRVYTGVGLTVPPIWVKEKLLAKPEPDVVDISKPAGAVTNKLAVRPEPATVKVFSVDILPAHALNALSAPVMVMVAAGLTTV